MSDAWLYNLSREELILQGREIKKQLKHRTYKDDYKKFKATPPETYQEYLDRDKARPKSKYEVPYLKGELTV